MAYTTPTVTDKDAPIDGATHIVVVFSGAGETPVRVEHVLRGESLAELKDWAFRKAAELNTHKSTRDVIPSIPFVIPLERIIAPARPANELWAEKARRLEHARALGIVTAATLLTEINALADDVRTSYQAGFLGSL